MISDFVMLSKKGIKDFRALHLSTNCSFVNQNVVVHIPCSVWNSFGVYCTVMALILLGRAAFVFPLSALSNCMDRTSREPSPITLKHQVS